MSKYPLAAVKIEHKLYPLALKLVASGRARVVNERVEIDGPRGEAQASLFVPPVA